MFLESKGLTAMASIAPWDLYRFGMDGHQQEASSSHIQKWEMREPGSLNRIMKAFAGVIDKVISRQAFNVSDVLKIHQTCMLSDGLFRRVGDPYVYFNLSYKENNLSQNGLKELIHQGAEIIGPKERLQLFIDPMQMRFSLQESISLERTPKKIQDLCKQYEDAVKTEYVAPYKSNDDLHIDVDTILSEFYQQIETMPAEHHNERLKAIVFAIQRLELLHPFLDGNCRTFCIVLLNAILMQHDFLPVILDNPNQFDGYSTQELVQSIIKGMDKTEQLICKASEESSSLSRQEQEDYSHQLHLKLTEYKQHLILNQATETDRDKSEDNVSSVDTRYCFYPTEPQSDSTKKQLSFFATDDASDEEFSSSSP